MSNHKPLELILARNLLSIISTPAFLAGEDGTLLFFNDAAGAMIGRRFEETGELDAAHWTGEFGPVDEHGRPLTYEEIPLTGALREGRPAHTTLRIRDGSSYREIAASAIPIVGPRGSSGAIVIFWPVKSNEDGQALSSD